MSSKLFKPDSDKKACRPLDPTTRQEPEQRKPKPSKAQLKNPGKAKPSQSLNNYNTVREHIENELQTSRRSSGPEATVKKRVSIGLT